MVAAPAIGGSFIIGVSKMSPLEDNLKSVAVQFSEDELKQLAEASQLPAEYPGWMLDYTPAATGSSRLLSS